MDLEAAQVVLNQKRSLKYKEFDCIECNPFTCLRVRGPLHMSDDSIQKINKTSSIADNQARIQRLEAARHAQMLEARQILTQETMEENTEQAMFNPLALLKNADTLERRIRRNEQRQDVKNEEGDPEVTEIDAITKTAQDFEHRNPELNKRALLSLKTFIEIDDTPEQILAKVLKSYPDPFLADEALDFLCDSSDPKTKVGNNLRQARILLNNQFTREVKAGRNMNAEAQEFAKQGLGTAGSLRDLYREITGSPRDPATLFDELSNMFNFDKLRTVIKFILHSIGSDLKAKGPSIERGQLQQLFTEARTMQAILGVYRFFFQRMKMIESQFHREGLTLPSRVTFDNLAKLFVKLIMERYPSPDKVLRFGSMLGISEELLAQIIIYTQFRDAIRGVSPQLFKSDKHRQDMLMTLIETISELDDLLEEEAEEDGKEDEKPPGWNAKDTVE